MTQIKDLRDRVKGIRNTQKITKAMKSMALIRLQKAELRALASRPFIYGITDIVSALEVDNIYFKEGRSAEVAVLIFTSDSGLCGAFNENIIRAAEREIEAIERDGKRKCGLILVGTKATVHFARSGRKIYSTYTHLPPDPTVSLSNLVMNDCRKLFLEGKAGEVILVYSNFKSRLKYEMKVKKMLPVPHAAWPAEYRG